MPKPDPAAGARPEDGSAEAPGAVAAPALVPDETCATCAWFIDDPQELERAFTGIGALSSAYGSCRGRAGICRIDQGFRDPRGACADFRRRGA